MADKIYSVQVNQTSGGRSAKDVSKDEIHVRASFALDDDKWTPIITQVSDEYARIMLSSAGVVGVIVSQLDENNGYEAQRGQFRSVGMNKPGLRAIPAGQVAATSDICALFLKNAKIGHQGRLTVRNCFFDSDVTTGADGSPVLSDAFVRDDMNYFDEHIHETFHAQGLECVMSPNNGNTGVADWRIVNSFAFAGVTRKQRRNVSTSYERQEENLFKRGLRAVLRTIHDAIHKAGSSIPAQVLALIGSEVEKFVAKWTLERILKAAVDFAAIQIFRAAALIAVPL